MSTARKEVASKAVLRSAPKRNLIYDRASEQTNVQGLVFKQKGGHLSFFPVLFDKDPSYQTLIFYPFSLHIHIYIYIPFPVSLTPLNPLTQRQQHRSPVSFTLFVPPAFLAFFLFMWPLNEKGFPMFTHLFATVRSASASKANRYKVHNRSTTLSPAPAYSLPQASYTRQSP